MAAGVRVLIADDHAPTRAGVRASLERHDFSICAEASDARSAVDAALRERPDVCLLDVSMPGGGIRAAAEIAGQLPRTVIVMLTVSRDDDDLFDALRAGASGYLLKDTSPERLPMALHGVLEGEAAVPRALVARMIDELRSRGARRRIPRLRRRGVELSRREWEVLELMREGLTTKQIAERLFVSPITVRRHISGVLAKLDVPDRASALALLEEER